jgi:hypothetical protein
VLRQKRQLASLVALGTELRSLRRALRLQLTAVAPWAAAVGALAGGSFAGGVLALGSGPGMFLPAVAVLMVGTAAVVGALTWLGCALAAQLLRGQIRDAVAPENLRAV